jgi:tight adherence protein B
MRIHALAPLLAAAGTPSLLPFVLISAIFGVLIGLAIWAIVARPNEVSRRVGGFVTTSQSRSARTRTLVERALGDKPTRTMPRSPLLEKARLELEVAEINLTPERLALVTIVGAVVVGWLLLSSTKSVFGALLGGLVPVGVVLGVRISAGRKRRLFSEQLPDNLQVIAAAMRAGQTFVGAMAAVVEDAPEPSKREMRRAVTDEALGVPLSEALGQVTERMKSPDFEHVAIVAALQRDTGGNTSEVIDLVSETIRERIELRRMVRSLTAQGRLAGLVLSLLPIGLLVLISLINPGYTHPLFHSTMGLIALAIGFVLSGLGSFLINKIVDIKV